MNRLGGAAHAHIDLQHPELPAVPAVGCDVSGYGDPIVHAPVGVEVGDN